MSSAQAPQTPQYRVTLFYGPEMLTADPPGVQCVFNVKKRSWRSGVQVAVGVSEEQLDAVRGAIEYGSWLHGLLQRVPEDERKSYEDRACDLLAQGLCALKLDLAIQAGISQENQTLSAGHLQHELSRAVLVHADRIRSQIATELDLPP